MKIYEFRVTPSLPPEIEGLNTLAYNLLWNWDDRIAGVFRSLDPDLWEETGHNPILLLGSLKPERIEAVINDDSYITRYKSAIERYERYFEDPTWYNDKIGDNENDLIAYFSPEFGLASCLPVYAGGLGVLAGDHTKSASDLGIPLIGIGLLYQQGYFRQYLNIDGWQQESYPLNDFFNLPLKPVEDDSGEPIIITVPYPEGEVAAQIWRVNVGRVEIYLLDTNITANTKKESRDITDQLYGGDEEHRIRQELMLGVGGVRALKALDIEPTAFHMNEGHAAFLALQRSLDLTAEASLTFDEARTLIGGSTIFTTHTPVPAGIDTFSPGLIDKYFGWIYKALNISRRDFLSLGRRDTDDDNEKFNMAYLATRFAYYCNGVSKLHGEVTRELWQNRWPALPTGEVPIKSVTNGIHTTTWVCEGIGSLFDSYLGYEWREKTRDKNVWERVEGIPSEELWSIHNEERENLISYIRLKLANDLKKRGAFPAEVTAASEILDPSILTVGFARRFATYKRATLIFNDPKRLIRLLTHPGKPVQFIFAGKAHPSDNAGKDFIREIIHTIRNPKIRPRVVFLEDYDISVARKLVSGVDVWLNNPRRPREASGTSGMKASVNGALNLSVLDGWWDEGFSADVGWAIGRGEEYEDREYQDSVESQAIYDLLEGEIASLFYDRDEHGIPFGWINMMKRAITKLTPAFSTDRMVAEYGERFYLPASYNSAKLADDDFAQARRLADWERKIRAAWPKVNIREVSPAGNGELKIGEDIEVKAVVDLGGLKPEDILVQSYFGAMDGDRQIDNGYTVDMAPSKHSGESVHTYKCKIPCDHSGRNGYTVRILPYHPDAVSVYDLGLIRWFG